MLAKGATAHLYFSLHKELLFLLSYSRGLHHSIITGGLLCAMSGHSRFLMYEVNI